ncbi:MAG: HAD family hydrolase, partial [Bacteroidota bacterium]|nr:HAD family hydrolase [Bacteroidota bacterium]
KSLVKHINYLLDNSKIMYPIPTNTAVSLTNNKPIKAVVFDIYGTLLISSSGDIKEASLDKSSIIKALDAGNYVIVSELLEEKLDDILWDYSKTIIKHQNKIRSSEIPFPEIDIKKVWAEIIDLFINRNILATTKNSNLEKFIVTFEILSNPVYAMPQMLETINYLANKKIPLGIVSNAQFYSPYIFNYFLKNPLKEDDMPPFDKDICVFSYKYSRGKPDIFLYNQLLPIFKNKYNIKPNEILFIGNDMHKDIFAASEAGMRTALFAGDKRSLKPLKQNIKKITPDITITNLFQLTKIDKL